MRGPLHGPGGIAQVRRRPLAPPAARPSSYAHGRMANADAFIERIAAGLLLLAVIATFTLSSSVLTNWKIHYLTAGGNFYEKLHPVTYFAFLAFGLLLLRSRGPIGAIDRMFSEAKLLVVYLVCWLFLLVQMFVLERPFTVIIDTFLLPVVLCLVIWELAPAQRRLLVGAVHLTVLVNVLLGYYEYFSGHRLIPLTLGDVIVLGEWRSSALLGHPLTASGLIAAYVLALVLRPALCPPLALRQRTHVVPDARLLRVHLGRADAVGGGRHRRRGALGRDAFLGERARERGLRPRLRADAALLRQVRVQRRVELRVAAVEPRVQRRDRVEARLVHRRVRLVGAHSLSLARGRIDPRLRGAGP